MVTEILYVSEKYVVTYASAKGNDFSEKDTIMKFYCFTNKK